MLGSNIKALRKQKGYSQETLAEQLNVVRQTISKWEKGYSVPDADMLERMANIFDVSVSELLGNDIPNDNTTSDIQEVVQQLVILNEQLARQSRNRKRILKIVLTSIAAMMLISVISYVVAFSLFKHERSTSSTTTVQLQCSLNGEEYLYGITYDDQYRIITAGGNSWIADHVQTEQYSDANILIAQIEEYFVIRGGTCEIMEE